MKRFSKSDRGVTAIEFAMVGGPFIYLMGVIFETGLMLFTDMRSRTASPAPPA